MINCSAEHRYQSAISALRRQLVWLPTNRQEAFNNGILCGMSKIKEVWGRDMEDLPADTLRYSNRSPHTDHERYQYAVTTLRRKVEAVQYPSRWRDAYQKGILQAVALIEQIWGPAVCGWPDFQSESGRTML